MGILLTLVVLMTVIVIHEFGHFVLMRRNDVTVKEFSIGMGPALWQRKTQSGMVLSVRILPIGGYVMPAASDDEGVTVASRSPWAQFKIYMAGMFVNATAAFMVALGIQYYLGGVFEKLVPYVDWAPVWAQIPLASFISSYGLWLATPVLIVYLAVSQGAAFFNGVAGPIGIVTMGNSMVEQSQTLAQLVIGQLAFFHMINVAIAGFNLLPIPPLDGGHVFVLFLRKLRMPEKAITHFSRLGLVFFLVLVVLIIGSDIVKLFYKG